VPFPAPRYACYRRSAHAVEHAINNTAVVVGCPPMQVGVSRMQTRTYLSETMGVVGTWAW